MEQEMFKGKKATAIEMNVKRRGRSKPTIWLQRNSGKGFGAEKRFTVSLRCQISIGSRYTNNSRAASSRFSLGQDRPSVPGTDWHATSKLLETCFVIVDQPKWNSQSLLFILLPQAFSVSTTVLQPNVQMIAACTELISPCRYSVITDDHQQHTNHQAFRPNS